MYRLRADVAIEQTDINVARGVGDTLEGAFADPRDPSLGWRAYDGRKGDTADWVALRVKAGVPESGIELRPNESYPLEQRFEALNGVDFKKGCYVGQEVTALVVKVDANEQKISLSIRAVNDKAERAALKEIAQQQASSQTTTLGDLLAEKLAAQNSEASGDETGE